MARIEFKRIKTKKKMPDFRVFNNFSVVVGLPADIIHEPSGMTMAEIGTVHEFGSTDGRIPERSFLRSLKVDRKKDIAKIARVLAKGVVAGKDERESLEILALWAQGAVEEQIVNLREPQNAPSTLRGKEPKTNPLIDTGAMRRGIVGRVVEND